MYLLDTKYSTLESFHLNFNSNSGNPKKTAAEAAVFLADSRYCSQGFSLSFP